jgi:single-stranded DNA-binding protein
MAAKFTAEDGERQQITTFIDIKVWGPSVENFAKLARKGQEILVDGSIRQDTCEDEESGQKLLTRFGCGRSAKFQLPPLLRTSR